MIEKAKNYCGLVLSIYVEKGSLKLAMKKRQKLTGPMYLVVDVNVTFSN